MSEAGGTTWTALCIAERLRKSDMVYVADDDQQGQEIASALQAILPGHPIVFVPSSDALPGDTAPASPANVGARVAALHDLHLSQQPARRKRIVCIFSGEAAARRYPPPHAFANAPPQIAVGENFQAEAFAASLATIGYYADDRVDEPGEMAIRGDVIDIFPADAGLPARIAFADGQVTAIRCYDPITQRSVNELMSISIGRVAEPALEEAVAILAHLPPASIAFGPEANERRRRFIRLADDAVRHRNTAPDAIDDEGWAAALSQWRTVDLPAPDELVPRFAEKRLPLAALKTFAQPRLETRALVLAGSERDIRFLRRKVAKRLAMDFAECADWDALRKLKAGEAATIVLPADQGFVDDRRMVVAAADLLGSRAELADAPGSSAVSPWTQTYDPLKVGDLVIHEDHGIGMVAGLEAAAGSDEPAEHLVMEFAAGARRLVAVDEADRIWRYGGDADAVTLDRLDGSSWQKRRLTIDSAINDSAKALAELAGQRDALDAPVIEPDSAAYEKFANGFAFNETADQARAITAVREDLARGKPMDRLVVGDVGYGKTEVALRAAALTALAGYQVIVAAPTTVLVRQHLETFRRRFDDSGIVVAGLSRLSSAAEKKAVIAGLADGSIGVVVGTAAVMAKAVRYAKLGLVVIDEEQRFGAADKAKLRGDGSIHLLALSATPIPRTLQMALIGLQQISIIATPPARRQPIRTSVDQYDDTRIRTALLREKGRGGQSFVVVPRIEDMPKLGERLRRLVPNFDIVEAHGKMAAVEIDRAMVEFSDGHGDIMLATNIIEAGLDVPRANTMIVWRADRFGLAQLHQLRGRVGRGNRRGQVILLTDDDDKIDERTLKRLRTLAAFDRLGAGFDISAQDLDMRGAGDLLGDDQAGHIRLIGIDFYQHLLGSALRQARGEDVERWAPELNLGLAGALPGDWIPEPDTRLSLYLRIARIEDDLSLDAMEEEMADRFGPLPPAAETLLALARLRVAARSAGIARIDAGPAAIALTPHQNFQGDLPAAGLKEKDGRFLLTGDFARADRIAEAHAVLDALADSQR